MHNRLVVDMLPKRDISRCLDEILPEADDRISVKDRIHADDRNIFYRRLCDEQPIKGISFVPSSIKERAVGLRAYSESPF